MSYINLRITLEAIKLMTTARHTAIEAITRTITHGLLPVTGKIEAPATIGTTALAAAGPEVAPRTVPVVECE
jgi:hypothetical protein